MYSKKIILSAVLAVFMAFIATTSYAQIKITFPNDNNSSYDNATIVNQYAPEVMSAGQSYKVSITMKNTGNSTWNSSSLLDIFTGAYALTPTGNDKNFWNLNSVGISSDVRPGESHSFDFAVTAPRSNGNYTMQWRMMNGSTFFGEYSKMLNVRVNDGTTRDDRDPRSDDRSYDNATIVNQYVPEVMSAGQSYKVSITMKNTGNSTWNSSSLLDIFTGAYALTTTGNDKNFWNLTPVGISSDVRPGESHSFDFAVTAPRSNGNYTMQWRMTNGSTFFGEYSKMLNVRVDNGTVRDDRDPRNDDRYYGDDNSSFIGHTIPSVFKTNRAYPVTVTFLNTGVSTWERGYYTLESVSNASGASNYDVKNVRIDKVVRPGDKTSIKLIVKAPTQSGVYYYQWRMSSESRGQFGETTPLIKVEVNNHPHGEYRNDDDSDDDDDEKKSNKKKNKNNNKNKNKSNR